jgi:hypothetical protein
LVVYLKKVSLYIDEELWARFKEFVLRKHGTLRKLSCEVENLLQTSLVDEKVRQAFEKMSVDVRTLISPEEIKRERPKLRGPPSENLIREMREKPVAKGISR